jgi:hypothetical protein
MKRIQLAEVSEAVRMFVTQALQSGGVEIEDENGRLRGTFVPYRDPTPDQRRRAQAKLEELWETTRRAMQEAGVTEEDIDRELQDED